MALAPSVLNDAINRVVNDFTGQRIAMPNGLYHGECTAPITWYLQYMGVPWNIPMVGSRADGWGVSFPGELAPYFTHEVFQQGKAYPRGSILMWNSPHIALVLNDAGGDNAVTCFEQNADPDGAPCGTHTRLLNTSSHTCTFALVPIIENAPAPPPVPAAPTFTVIETYANGKQVKLNKQPTHLWGMNYQFDYMKDHPVETHDAGEVWTVTNKVHHVDGMDYYRREGQVDGFNVADCDDYTPPPPAAPVPFPGNGTIFSVIVPLQGYQSATQAGNHSGVASAVPEGEYFVFRYYPGNDKLVNITKDKSKPGWWVNAEDNVLPPPPPPIVAQPGEWVSPRESSAPEPTPVVVPDLEPEPVHEPTAPVDWKASYLPFNPGTGDGNITTPREYQVNLDGRIWNLDETGPDVNVFISKNQRVHVYGTVVKEGVKYYRLKVKRDVHFDWWLCAPISFNNMAVLTVPGPSWMDRMFHRGEQLKSIFTDGEAQFIDSIQLNPFHRKKK